MAERKQDAPHHESVLFHPVLKAYATNHSWKITAHISLGDLNRQLCMFNSQKTLAHQLLVKLRDQLLTSTCTQCSSGSIFYIDSIYESYRPTIRSTVQLLKTDSENMSPPENPHSKRCLLPFLGDALKKLTGTATTTDTWEIKQHMNQLIQEQTKQQQTLVHVMSILNITRYAAQVNRQNLNEIIDALQRSNEDLNKLFNITEDLTQCFRYQQMYIYVHTILAYLTDSLTSLRQVAIHMMDYVDVATTNIPSPDILPVEDLRNMLDT